ncbi:MULTISPECIES: hypothetical protein [Gracilibacillus]|uniref:hypothetical protein n=1 Tax=Gracilibacillus TaxID=74385 RepID=UPI000826257D|nr:MULTISPECIES: hypothetical protein [Gracilibacillus]
MDELILGPDLRVMIILIGFLLGALEMILVKKFGVNLWVLPIITWIISAGLALTVSATLGAFPSLMLLVIVLIFYINDHFNKFKYRNNADEKMKIKDLK